MIATMEVSAELAFAHPRHVTVDAATGLGRARTLPIDVDVDEDAFDLRTCRLADLAAPGAVTPDLRTHGFAHVELHGVRGLCDRLRRVRDRGRLDDGDLGKIRRVLTGASLPLSGGHRLRVLFIAREGFILRRTAPNGLAASGDPDDPVHHKAARIVHVDQDVDGTPVRQILRGAAPWLFHHESPRSRNARSPLFLLNLWIPLEQITTPLALLDGRTLDRRTHQLRYGLPTDTFLQRDPDRTVNDIWMLRHHPGQRWYFTSEMPLGRAYVFETLATAHAAFILPGEDLAAHRYRQLDAALGGTAPPAAPPPALDPATPSPLRAALRAAADLVAESPSAPDWVARARALRSRLTRKSLELRMLAWVPRRPGR